MLKSKSALAIATICSALSGCYVVPIQQYPAANNPPANAIAPIPIPRPIYTARLYPVNDVAAAMGRISGTISNPERGHGQFSLSAAGETYMGEATRAPNSTRGTANATGNRGGYIKCEYTMTSNTLGAGTCLFSGGARYDMHVSL